MSYISRDLNPLVRGDDWSIKLIISSGGVPLDITGSTFWFTLKSAVDSPDPGDLQVTAIPTNSTDAESGIIYITASKSLTDALEAKTYSYDIQQVNSQGLVNTILIGKVKVVKDITRST